MTSLPDQILVLVQTSAGLTDREITDSLIARGAPQQHVNQTCHRLELQGRLSRRPCPDGKIGNYPAEHSPAEFTASGTNPGHEEFLDPSTRDGVLHWSDEIQFDTAAIARVVPYRAGVYQILQSTEYPRYEGTTRILKIGKSLKDLCSELLDHFQRHTAANRLSRIRRKLGVTVTLTFAETDPESASRHEQLLLRLFEDTHWDLPVLNSQRGHERGGDAHYCEPPGANAG